MDLQTLLVWWNEVTSRQPFYASGRFTSERYVIEHTIVPEREEDIPTIICYASSGRSYSTAWLFWIMSQLQIPGAYQPLKTLRRFACLFGGNFVIPSINGNLPSYFAMKEVFSAMYPEECLYDPVDLLIQAGAPRRKIVLVTGMRDPVWCVNSWWKFIQTMPAEVFAGTIIHTANLYQKWENQGLRAVIPLVDVVLREEGDLAVLNRAHELARLPTAQGLEFDRHWIDRYLRLGEGAKRDTYEATIAPRLRRGSFWCPSEHDQMRVPKPYAQAVRSSCQQIYENYVSMTRQVLGF